MLYYFDNAATTQLDSSLAELWKKYSCESYFNPSASSDHSTEVFKAIEDARIKVAKSLGADADEIYFTSGGTESDNLAILGAVGAKKGNIVTSRVEHPAVYNTIKYLKNKGIEIRYADLDGEGAAKEESIRSLVDDETLLVSLMHVNNETGAVNDIEKLSCAAKSKNKNLLFMSDGVQAYGKIPVRLHSAPIDLYTLSGHKIHAPKGVGALFIKKGIRLSPVLHGGGQEKDIRPGTENVANIVCLGKIAEQLSADLINSNSNFENMKNTILRIVSDSDLDFLNLSQNGTNSLIYLVFKNIKSEVLMRLLENDGFIVGNGSACSSKHKSSRLLEVLGVPKEYSEGGIRISFGKYNTVKQAELLAEAIVKNAAILKGVK